MIALRVALGDKSQHGALHAKIEKAQVANGGDCNDPDAIGDVSQPMHDEGGEKESDCHVSNRSKPVEEYVSRNMSYTQRQANSPGCFRTAD